ncbi:hypothetical protein Clacol_004776 [Clathrus columnatus]|uniref:USP domain-containing protein n=1 Tax=Clathrus columnatus TaxID=1419009 RepID=A0AAV5ABF6_9AGAM|nr:hypothetical protein Clacol_004776 [Clathrus columnatus]
MNSVLQGFFATDILRQMVEFQSQNGDSHLPAVFSPRRSPLLTNRRGPEDVQQEWSGGLPVGDVFIQTLERAWMAQDKKERASLSPKELLTHLGKKYDQYLDFRQQDAHEFFIHLLDCMRMEELDVRFFFFTPLFAFLPDICPQIIKKRQSSLSKDKTRPRSNTATPDFPSDETHSLKSIPEEERLISFVDMIWGGRFTSYLICTTCKHVSHTYEDFDDLSLSIRHDESRERKRDRLRAFASKFMTTSGGTSHWHKYNIYNLPRAHSQPPSPPLNGSKLEQSLGLELSNIPEMIRRRSFESTATAAVSMHADVTEKVDKGDNMLDVEKTRERILEEISSMAANVLASDVNGSASGTSTPAPEFFRVSSTTTVPSATLNTIPASAPATPVISPATSGTWSKKVGDRITRRISMTMSKSAKLGMEMMKVASGGNGEKSDTDAGGVAAALEKLTGGPTVGPKPLISASPELHAHLDSNLMTASSATLPKSKRHSALALRHRLREHELNRKNKTPALGRETLEAIYLTRILQDTGPAYSNPLQLLKASTGSIGNSTGASSTITISSGSGMQTLMGQLPRLNIGGTSQSIEECLRTFTAVEALDGENMFGCHTCWKMAHGKITARRPVNSDDSSDEGETKSTPLDKAADSEFIVKPPPMLSEGGRMNTSLSVMTNSSVQSTTSSISTLSALSESGIRTTVPEAEEIRSDADKNGKFSFTPAEMSVTAKTRQPSEESSTSSASANSVDGGSSFDITIDTPPSSASIASHKTLTICTSPESAGDSKGDESGTASSSATREIPTIAMTMSSPIPPENLKEEMPGYGISIPLPSGVPPDAKDALRLPERSFRHGFGYGQFRDEFGSESSMTSASEDEHEEASNVSDASSVSAGPPPGLIVPGSPRRSRSISIPRSKQVIYRRALKRYLIAMPPPILVIHLKRFQQVSKSPLTLFGNLKKLDDYVSFPEHLNIQPFLAPRKEDYGLGRGEMEGKVAKKGTRIEDKPCVYRLYAVVVHIGNMLGGHYVAYTALPPSDTLPLDTGKDKSKTMESGKGHQHSGSQHSQRQWCYISDTEVKLVTLDEVLKAKAYLCMYERVVDYQPAKVGSATKVHKIPPSTTQAQGSSNNVPATNSLFGGAESVPATLTKETSTIDSRHQWSFETRSPRRTTILELSKNEAFEMKPPQDPSDFLWLMTEEPHRSRRMQILKEHPEVKKLMGYEPLTKYVTFSVVALQLVIAIWFRQTSPFSLPFVLVAYVIGGTANHNLFLAIHEITHNLAFKGIVLNKLLAIMANLPIGIPYAVTFKVGYHNEHHDFPSIPWTRLPLLHQLAPEFYKHMASHPSWPMIVLNFIRDKEVGIFARAKRLGKDKKDTALNDPTSNGNLSRYSTDDDSTSTLDSTRRRKA